MMQPEDLILQLWKPNSQRARLKNFEPAFARYVGALEESEYDNLLATIDQQAKAHPDHTLILNGPAGWHPDFNVLRTLKEGLPELDLDHVRTEQLRLFSDTRKNEIWLKALSQVLKLARRNGIKGRKAEENFISTMVVLSLDLLNNLVMEDRMASKIIHYGDLDERTFYFLMLAHMMGLDVLSFTPSRESSYWSLDLDGLNQRNSLKYVLPVYSFEYRASRGEPISKTKTAVSLSSREVNDYLFSDTGIFKPWSFRGKDNMAVLLDGTPIDVSISWNNEARIREGFEVDNNKKVHVPHFFFEQQGMDNDVRNLFLSIAQSPNVIVSTDLSQFLTSGINRFKLPFTQKPDGSFDLQKLRNLPDYPYSDLNNETETFVITKLNELIKRQKAIFTQPLKREEILDLAQTALSLDRSLLKLIDTFDYPFQVPKIVLFLERERSLSKREINLLALLSVMGFDLAVFSPAGQSLLSKNLRSSQFSTFRAEKMDYGLSLKDMESQTERKSGWSRMLSDIFGTR